MPIRDIEVQGGRLPAEDAGAGPPIVLLHAGVADLRAWDGVVPPLVAAGYHVIRYDARGFGASTTDDVEFSHRADVIAVLDAYGLGRAALVGNSRGGMAALDTAIEYPERVVAVVGVAAGVSGFDGDATPEETRIFEAYERLEEAEPFDADALTDYEVRVWMDGPGQSPDRVSPAIREALRAMDRPINDPGRVRGRSIPLDPPANDRLAELRCPVLMVAGRLDFGNAAWSAMRVASAAPSARAEVWPDVAHMIGMEQPDRLAAAIMAFLAPLDRWT